MTTLLYRTPEGPVASIGGQHYSIPGAGDWDALLNHDDLVEFLTRECTFPA